MTEQQQTPKQLMLDRQQCATVVYNDLKESQRATFAVSAEYGRWLLGSLFILHGGALFGLFTFLGDVADQPELLSAYAAAVWWFLIGLLLAMLSGFFAWMNWSMHSSNYESSANVAMLWDPTQWTGKAPHDVGLYITNRGSTLLGFASALCTIGAADAIVNQSHLVKLIVEVVVSETILTVGSDVLLAFGLLLTVVGAGITASAVVLNEDDAIGIGVSRFASANREENLKLPAVQNLLRASRAAKRGLWTIAWGTGFQLSTIFVKPIIWAIGT